jgi:dTDP-4-dehydrorhamnose reductase
MEASVESVLIAGIESVVGANLAATLSDRSHVVGLSFSDPVALTCCQTAVCAADDTEAIHEWISSASPDAIVYCGPAAMSNWQYGKPQLAKSAALEIAGVRNWSKAARDADCRLTYVSSDAVFTGPWMFHAEESTGLCDSPQAVAFRSAESLALQTAPDALVVRTNVYGWAPHADSPGWLEQILSDLETESAGTFDYLRHATPILASDFAAILIKAWEMELTGVYHIAGAERVNPNQFVERLADEFLLPGPLPVDGNCLTERPRGFGCGESSLHTNKIRNAVKMAMPTVADGLRRLREQTLSGYCDRLATEGAPVQGKVA